MRLRHAIALVGLTVALGAPATALALPARAITARALPAPPIAARAIAIRESAARLPSGGPAASQDAARAVARPADLWAAAGGRPVRQVRRSGILPPEHPPRNLPSTPRLAGALCSSSTSGATTTYHCDNPCANARAVLEGVPPALNNSPACTAVTLRAIDHARAAEGVGPMVLPRDWAALTVDEQLFVVTDLERVARGEPPFVGLVPALDSAAHAGAVAATDPEYPLSQSVPGPESSNWAGDEYSPLIADYEWMYDDGFGRGGGNVDCTTPRDAGCWGHRANILGAVTGVSCRSCVMGAGYATGVHGFGTSYTELFLAVAPSSRLRPTFTWAKNVAPELAKG